MGPRERLLVLLLVCLGVLGHAARILAGDPTAPPGEAVSFSGLEAGSPGAHAARVVEAVRPLGSGERIDPDRAPVAELARLPGIGIRLAKEIVADRELRGSFGSPDGLLRVDGIGPATVRRLEPHLRFAGRVPVRDRRVNLNAATRQDLERLPGIGPARARAILAYRDGNGPFAEPADLERVPGVSARLARRLAPLVRVR